MTDRPAIPWEYPRWTGEREFRRAQSIMRTAARHSLHYTPAFRLVYEELADYINFVGGYAYPGQKRLAIDLGLNERTVRQAMIAVNGHLFAVTLVGRNYRYYPIWGAVGIIPGTWPTAAKNSAFETKKPDNSYRNSGKKLHRTAEKNSPLSYLSNLQSDLSGARSGNVIDAVDRLSDRSKHPDSSGGLESGWPAVKERLRKRFGPDLAASWFEKLTLEESTDSECVIAAPSKFILNYIKSNYATAIEQEWHACHPAAQPACVRFVLREMRAAE